MELSKTFKIAIFALFSGLTGCYRTTTPQEVLGAVGQSVQNNDFASYVSFFKGEALQKYGNPSFFNSLKEEAKLIKSQPQVQLTLLSTKALSETKTLKNYDANVLLPSGNIDVQVACVTEQTKTIRRVCHGSKKHRDCHNVVSPSVFKNCSIVK